MYCSVCAGSCSMGVFPEAQSDHNVGWLEVWGLLRTGVVLWSGVVEGGEGDVGACASGVLWLVLLLRLCASLVQLGDGVS